MLDLATCSFMFCSGFVALVTYFKSRSMRIENYDGYFLANRSLSAGVISGSLLLTNISTEQIIGMNGLAFQDGVQCIAWEIVAAIALIILGIYVVPQYLKLGIRTITEFLQNRYDDTLRLCIDCLFVSGYLLSTPSGSFLQSPNVKFKGNFPKYLGS